MRNLQTGRSHSICGVGPGQGFGQDRVLEGDWEGKEVRKDAGSGRNLRSRSCFSFGTFFFRLASFFLPDGGGREEELAYLLFFYCWLRGSLFCLGSPWVSESLIGLVCVFIREFQGRLLRQ